MILKMKHYMSIKKYSDEKILEIIMLKIQGYSIREISKITGLTTNQIYKRIKKLKKVL